MARKGGRRAEAGAPAGGRGTQRRMPEELELRALLRDAEEALREAQVPSGDWTAEGLSPHGEGTPAEESWTRLDAAAAPEDPGPEGCGLDPETAFWLLFPPRGNA